MPKTLSSKDIEGDQDGPRTVRAASTPMGGHNADGTTTPTETPVRLTRKRAASLMAAPLDGLSDLPRTPVTVGGPTTGEALTQVCLCPPDPKIPRPRNAFMLYRQHLQGSIVAQHPGLANPEISKIIGKQWREESQEVRENWDALAEEEKQRHHQQFPHYKYQPRRKAKRGPGISTDESPGLSESWCGKCGRRNIATPSTPLTPFTPGFARNLPPLALSTSSTPSTGDFDQHLPPMATPMTAGAPIRRRPTFPSVDVSKLTLDSPLGTRDADAVTPITPDLKRRRYNGYSTSLPGLRLSERGSPRLPPSAGGHGRMGPPPRPPFALSPSTPSLTLPPLQAIQGQSVEVMIKTIPCINKIKALARICPPLPPADPTDSAVHTRGALVAIDGEDKESVSQVAKFLEEELGRVDGNLTKVFGGPVEQPGLAEDTTTVGNHGLLLRYINSITAWHQKAQEVSNFLTTAPSADDSSPRHPVALFPSYLLTHANSASIQLPINDAYAPVEHWNWVAMMFRGILGPDLTIWVKQCSKEEVSRCGGVEVREDARALVVRFAGEAGVEPKVARRLGFEVGEWVRGVASGEGWGSRRG
ncbi:MAG: hypothetical protein M1833_006671 [Piccolia ochrophora]|nr:MAG: hypothetical protein M1833_006671 [Piccolia ochrophora]